MTTHYLNIQRATGLARLAKGYEAIYRGAVIFQGRRPVANSARELLDKGLAAPGDVLVARRKAAGTRRGIVGELAARLDA